MVWEIFAWLILILAALVLRFHMLGVRAMSHDESLHAYYSYVFSSKGTYQHDPMMHGPLLFHMNSIVFRLFGDSDLTARVVPAVAGAGIVALTLAYRRYLGAVGALVAAFLFTVSPSLLFYSRYIRNDVYSVFFAMLWILGAFRYADTGKLPWIYLMVFGMAFSFVTKEVSFITGAIIGSFFLANALWGIRKDRNFRTSPFADLSILMLTAVLPFASPFIRLLAGRDVMAYQTPGGIVESAVLIGVMTVISAVIAYAWFGLRKDSADSGKVPSLGFLHWVAFMLLFWNIQCLFFSTFFANPKGLLSGIAGSLGYWLTQQGVARGGQPVYYYALLVSLYEFLPAILVIGAATAGIKKDAFHRFLFWWTIGAWILYTGAGEKMPWLVVHLVVPMGLLGACWLGNVIQELKWGQIYKQKTVWMIPAVPIFVFAVLGLFHASPLQERDLESLRLSMRWIRDLTWGIALFYYMAWCLRKTGWKMWRQLAGLGLVALFAVYTVNVSLNLSFKNFDLATEFLVYAHGTPDIKKALREIESTSERTVGDKNIAIANDDETSWPFSWYLRHYPNQIHYGDTPGSDAMKAPIVLVGPKNYDKVRPLVSKTNVKRTYIQIWWPLPVKTSWQKIKETLLEPNQWYRLRRILLYREYSGDDLRKWPERREFEMYVDESQSDILYFRGNKELWDRFVLKSRKEKKKIFDILRPAIDNFLEQK